MITYNNSELKKRYIGDKEVNKVYIGDNLVFANEDYYGVMWPATQEADSVITRIGRDDWHKTLPIHNKMRRCILGTNTTNTDTIIRYIHPDNYLVDTNLNPIDYTKSKETVDSIEWNYDVMVEVPEHYYECGTEAVDGVDYNYIKLYPYAKKGKRVPMHYVGAFEALLNRTTDQLFSCVKANIVYTDDAVNNIDLTFADDAATYRGGDNSTSYTGAKTLLGRPVTNININTFVDYAKNKNSDNSLRGGHAIVNWASKSCINRLFVVEFASFDSQAAFVEPVEGQYHTGGLGVGVTSTVDNWNRYNRYNPIIPCGITLRLVNNTGVVTCNLGDSYVDGIASFDVPSYRGIENPFGHIWEITNGMLANGQTIYTIKDNDRCDDWYVKDFTSTRDSSIHKTKVTTPNAQGYIATFVWDADGDFVPETQTGTTSSPQSVSILKDFSWCQNSGYKRLRVGGYVASGSRAGLFAFGVAHSVSYAAASIGSRLLYMPVSNN